MSLEDLKKNYRSLKEAVRDGEEALTKAQQTGDLNKLTFASKEVSMAMQNAKEALERDTIEILHNKRLFRPEYEALLKVARDNRVSRDRMLQGVRRIKCGRITEIRLWGLGLTNISGLSGLTNLIELSLVRNKISDLTPLSGLKRLTKLSLRKNLIYDVAPLKGLSRLQTLSLDENKISALMPLTQLKAIRMLHVNSNDLDSCPIGSFLNEMAVSKLRESGCIVLGVDK